MSDKFGVFKRFANKVTEQPPQAETESRHLYIAGTGRAGTSFLVKYLTELGMDTTLTRQGENASWNDEAVAGLEQDPHQLFGKDVPYLVKSPWLYLVVDELLAKARNRIDGLIIPIRELGNAARSRISQERRSMIKAAPWLNALEKPWDVWATTPGGVIYSLNEMDQQRTLAVGLHILVERFVEADIPIVFLHFPRMVRDSDYLYNKLSHFIPSGVTNRSACAAFTRIADPSKLTQL